MTYKIQIDDLVRNATPDEVKVLQAQDDEKAEQEKVLAETTKAKTAAQAKLAALGLTLDELKALGL